MKSIGEIFKRRRIKQAKTLEQVHRQTKIPLKTLKALETDNFDCLPAATFIKGFISIYARNLGLDEKKLIAVFRRDWQKKESKEIMLSGLTTPFDRVNFWTPKLAGILTGVFFLTIFLGYLGFQLKNFFSPPRLMVEKPTENEQVKTEELEVKGKAERQASVYINGKLIDLDQQGNFSYQLRVFPGENRLEIKAVNRRGRERIVERKIEVRTGG